MRVGLWSAVQIPGQHEAKTLPCDTHYILPNPFSVSIPATQKGNTERRESLKNRLQLTFKKFKQQSDVTVKLRRTTTTTKTRSRWMTVTPSSPAPSSTHNNTGTQYHIKIQNSPTPSNPQPFPPSTAFPFHSFHPHTPPTASIIAALLIAPKRQPNQSFPPPTHA